MKALSIQFRLTLLVSFLLAVTVLAATANLMGRRQGSDRLHALYETRVEPLGRLLTLETLYGAQLARRVRDGADRPALKPLVAQGRAEWLALTQLEKAGRMPLSPGLADKWSRADQALSQAAPLDDDGRRSALQNLAALTDALTRAATDLRAMAAKDDSAGQRNYEGAVTRNIMIFGVILLLALWGSWRQIHSITGPIRRAVVLAEAVADGRLGLSIEAEGPRETRQLLLSLSSMSDKLQGVVREVRDNSESLATGCTEIAAGNADLSRRTESQASNLQQTAASMEELSATVRHNADAAQQADTLATQAADAARDGRARVDQMRATMQEITASSERIGDIIGVIDAIAFQTNILALNAAVEAARAGEHGRGFAVVAGEVRSLAKRSAEAAREVRQLIGASHSCVESGSQRAAQAGEAMAGIVERIRQVGALIGEISVGSKEQAKGLSEIGAAVSQLDEATQQNAALVEESAAATESLRGQARQLMELVARFELDASLQQT